MVVEENPADRFAEMVRLNRLIRSFDIAVDLLVVSDEKFQYWRETPGNVYYKAATGSRSSIKRVNKLCSFCARLLSDLGAAFHKTHELGALMDALASSGAP